MSRSVVQAGTVRCERCQLPPRWCICGAIAPVMSDLKVGILMHHREQWRPSSTGRLIERVCEGARTHVVRRDAPPEHSLVVEPGRELWVLHPRGERISRELPSPVAVDKVQVLLLDGSWSEATNLLRWVRSWGRCVSVGFVSTSRYWLRRQMAPGQLSTMEALVGVFEALNRPEEVARLRLHFELHVYASLRARGNTELAAEYLRDSPIREAIPEVLARLWERRPNAESLDSFRAMISAPDATRSVG